MKFKELRLLLICFIAFLGMIVISVQAILLKDTRRLILTILLSFMALTMVLGRFNMRLLDDCMLIYEFKIIGILPSMIDYKDVKEVKAVSRFKVRIMHRRKSTIYVLNAQKFADTLNGLLEQYHQKENEKCEK